METRHIPIAPLIIDGKQAYPETITQAVIDAETQKPISYFVDKLKHTATEEEDGLMSKEDKKLLNSVDEKIGDLGVLDANAVDRIYDEIFNESEGEE
jgi:hypothetical protein